MKKLILLPLLLMSISGIILGQGVIRPQDFINGNRSVKATNKATDKLIKLAEKQEKKYQKPHQKIAKTKLRNYIILDGVYSKQPAKPGELPPKAQAGEEKVGEYFGTPLFIKIDDTISVESSKAKNTNAPGSNAKKEKTDDRSVAAGWGVDKFYTLNSITNQIGLASGDIIVQFKDNSDPENLTLNYPVTLEKYFKYSKAARYKIKPNNDLLATVADLEKHPKVESVTLMIEENQLTAY